MERAIDSHQWVGKLETRFLRHFLSGKLGRETDADTQTTNGEPIESHLLQGGPGRKTVLAVKSQPVPVRRILLSKTNSEHGRDSADSIATCRFASRLLRDLHRFKA